MIFRIFGINQNVINEDHYEFVDFLHEDRVHEIDEVCWCIGKTKRHDQIFIESISGEKGCFWNVTRPDLCGRTNLNYTGSSTQVHSQGLKRTSNGVTPWPVR
jgi:hypothetical protein